MAENKKPDKPKYKITRLQLNGNEGTGLKPDVVYCALVEIATGREVISATLDYVLAAVRDRGYVVEGVTVGTEPAGSFYREQGVESHSVVKLDAYQ